jgi:hypothetical protein
MHFLDADPRRQPDEVRQLIDRLLEAGQPQRDARRRRADLALQRGELADIADDAVEHVLAAHLEEAFRLGGVERDAQFVEPGIDQLRRLRGASSVPLVLNST